MTVAAPTLTLPAGTGVAVGSSVSRKARLRKAPFGDGYTQRSRDGQNWLVSTFGLTVENLTKTESAALLAFFEERGGDLPFYFTPPGESAPKLWTCEQWDRKYVGTVHDTVRATLLEQFDH